MKESDIEYWSGCNYRGNSGANDYESVGATF